MNASYAEILGRKIIDKEKNVKLGNIENIEVDKNTGKILGLVTKQNKSISALDIIDWSPNILVKGKKQISDKKNNGIFLNNMRVETISNKYLGKVNDFSFDCNFLIINGILCFKKFLFIQYNQRIIPYSAIISIEEKKIIVKDDFEFVKNALKTGLKLKENISIEMA